MENGGVIEGERRSDCSSTEEGLKERCAKRLFFNGERIPTEGLFFDGEGFCG
ncbi:hypothetical protein A2U01_0095349, partial [Trifolium medium]|nr:hypothetical protein [Trifolium medium]